MPAITLLGSSFTTTSGTKTVTATPAVGDLIVIVTAHTGNTATTTPTDDNSSGTYTTVVNSKKLTNADTMMIHVRDTLIPAAVSTIFTHAPGASTGGGLVVYSLVAIKRLSSAAASQSSKEENLAAGTPAPVFTRVPRSASPIIGAAFYGSGTALTPRAGYTESPTPDLTYAVPAAGLESMFLASGEASATITWGSATATPFCSAVVELDTTNHILEFNVPTSV